MVEVSVTVGKLDASLALLLTKDHHLIEFPTLLLPNDVEAGSIVKISCERDIANESKDKKSFDSVQQEILSSFGLKEPSTPVLKVRNITQTSVVLEWDPINTATADVLSLTLFKNNQRFGLITSPLKRTSTKISGLAIDNAYTFHLVLATTAGVYTSEKITVKTHKMTDLSGITICLGDLSGSQIDENDLAETAKKVGAKPLQYNVKVDTTHFVCTVGEGPEWKRAQDLNIPVVTPEWVKACENERRLVGVKRYYLDADPKDRPPLQRSRAVSQTTNGSDNGDSKTKSSSSIPQLTVTEAEQHDGGDKELSHVSETEEGDADERSHPQTESKPETVSEPVQDSVSEPVQDSVSEPVPESVSESVSEPVSESQPEPEPQSHVPETPESELKGDRSDDPTPVSHIPRDEPKPESAPAVPAKDNVDSEEMEDVDLETSNENLASGDDASTNNNSTQQNKSGSSGSKKKNKKKNKKK